MRRLQRALNAATGKDLAVDGVVGLVDVAAVRRYQRRHHLPATGVVSSRTWRALQRGLL